MLNNRAFYGYEPAFLLTAFWVLFMVGSCRQSPAYPGLSLQKGTKYLLSTQITTNYSQQFMGDTSQYLQKGVAAWTLELSRQKADTQWIWMQLVQLKMDAVELSEEVLQLSALIPKIEVKQRVNSSVLLIEHADDYQKFLVDIIEKEMPKNISSQKKMVVNWLDTMFLRQLLHSVFALWPQAGIYEGQTWEPELKVAKPLAGAITFTGVCDSIGEKGAFVTLSGNFQSHPKQWLPGTLPYMADMKGITTVNALLPSKMGAPFLFMQTDSLSGNLNVAGRKVKTESEMTTRIEMRPM